MSTHREALGKLVKAHREQKRLSQTQVAKQIDNANRSAIAHLEQGLRLPSPKLLQEICEFLDVPREYWTPFTQEDTQQRFTFEAQLTELIGKSTNLAGQPETVQRAAQQQISRLFDDSPLSDQQALDLFNSILIFYGVQPVSKDFFLAYLGCAAFRSIQDFEQAIERYQKDAIRLFSTLPRAYEAFNNGQNLQLLRQPLQQNDLSQYTGRTEWNVIHQVHDEHLPDLGYISAARVRQEEAERQVLKSFLEDLARQLRAQGPTSISSINEKTRRRMDSFLRKFDSTLQHGLFSPLFAPDADELEREAARLAPKSEDELARMAETQEIALQNLAHYLSADHMDIYVATSMRNDADFVSVNQFVRDLFQHNLLRPLKLRYFNPTQSWLDDRIGKGLVEALMLRRSSATIYMAQKNDTFGKDSEASIALGQGKPVVVYVPKLAIPNIKLDTEHLARKTRTELEHKLHKEVKSESIDLDASIDDEALMARILMNQLKRATHKDLIKAVRRHWADFDLYGEAIRIHDEHARATYRNWLDSIIKESSFEPIPTEILEHLPGILVGTALRFERRAKVFQEIHPLALQVILSSGVLNGILVVRSIEQCAQILHALLQNNLQLRLDKDEQNIRLIEEITDSTIRVISRHRLLRNAFETFYKQHT